MAQQRIFNGVGNDGREYTIVEHVTALPQHAGGPVVHRRELRLATGELVTTIEVGRAYLVIRTGVRIQVFAPVA